MKFCDKKIQEHLLNGGKIKRIDDKCRFEYREVMLIDDVLRFADEEKEPCEIARSDLMANDWEIVEPEYNWDKIIEDKILCQFWDELDETDAMCVGYLTKKTVAGFYVNGWNYRWKNCKPFNPADFNIAKNIKDYEK